MTVAQKAHTKLVRPAAQQVSELGRICYEAFKDIADRHHFPPDFPSASVARQLIGMLVQRDDFYAVAALLDGEAVGSNFLCVADQVAAVGPITVDVPHQGQGIGRALMENVIEQARKRDIARVRLLQDGFNMASLSLYTSLGFDVKEAVGYMRAPAAAKTDPSIRPLAEDDLPIVEQLSTHTYKTSRRNEVAAAIHYGFGPLLRQREGRPCGYLIPGIFGHGVALTEDDALALAGEAARRSATGSVEFFCPLSEGNLYRAALKRGCRVIKVMNLMTLGPYEPPDAVWMPSVLY